MHRINPVLILTKAYILSFLAVKISNNLGFRRVTQSPYILPSRRKRPFLILVLLLVSCFPIRFTFCSLSTLLPFLQNDVPNPFHPQNPCSQILRRIAESKHVV